MHVLVCSCICLYACMHGCVYVYAGVWTYICACACADGGKQHCSSTAVRGGSAQAQAGAGHGPSLFSACDCPQLEARSVTRTLGLGLRRQEEQDASTSSTQQRLAGSEAATARVTVWTQVQGGRLNLRVPNPGSGPGRADRGCYDGDLPASWTLSTSSACVWPLLDLVHLVVCLRLSTRLLASVRNAVFSTRVLVPVSFVVCLRIPQRVCLRQRVVLAPVRCCATAPESHSSITLRLCARAMPLPMSHAADPNPPYGQGESHFLRRHGCAAAAAAAAAACTNNHTWEFACWRLFSVHIRHGL
jgi:hypothetical protein